MLLHYSDVSVDLEEEGKNETLSLRRDLGLR